MLLMHTKEGESQSVDSQQVSALIGAGTAIAVMVLDLGHQRHFRRTARR